MAFTQSKFCEIDVGCGTQSLRIFAYRDRTDNTVEEIAANGFFDSMKDVLRADDLIFVKGSDGETMFRVESVGTEAPYVITTYWSPIASYVKDTGQLTTVGGSATEAFTVAGISTTDFCFTQLVNDGTNNVSILSANITAANTLTVVFSGDPSSDTVFNYLISSKP